MRHSNHIILPESGKQYKLFLVEVDDDDRERVLSGLAGSVEIDQQVESASIYTEEYFLPVSSYDVPVKTTLTIVLQKRPDGTYFTIENFAEQEDE